MKTKKIEIKGVPRTFVSLPNANVLLLFRVKGVLSKEVLEASLKHISKKHQLLKAHISIDENDRAWFTFPENHHSVILESYSGDIHKTITNQFQHRLNLENGVLIQFCLIRENGSTNVLITCNHMICDGLSMCYLIKDILSNLESTQRKELDEQVPVFMSPDNIPVKLDVFPVSLFVNRINKEWKDKELHFTQRDYNAMSNHFWNRKVSAWENNDLFISRDEFMALNEDPWSKQRPQVVTHQFTEQQTKTLILHCKKNKVSVNTALTTAFVKAQETMLPANAYSSNVIIAVDLRDKLINPPGEIVGYYVSAIRLKLKYKKRKSFWSNASGFQKKIKAKLRSKHLFRSQIMGLLHHKFIDALNLNRYGERHDKSVRDLIRRKKLDSINAAFTISNLGLVDMPYTYGSYELEEIIPPFVQSDTMEKYISVLTFRNKLQLSISFSEHIISKNAVEQFLKTTEAILALNSEH